MSNTESLLYQKNNTFIKICYNVARGKYMNNIEIIEESKDRKIRRHEVSFSAIQGNQSQD